MFSFLGTMFLWVLWPSFNSVYAPAGLQSQAAINTVLCLCSRCVFLVFDPRSLWIHGWMTDSLSFCCFSTMTTYYFSGFFGGKFSGEIVRSVSLAGGIIAGSSVGILSQAWVAGETCFSDLASAFLLLLILLIRGKFSHTIHSFIHLQYWAVLSSVCSSLSSVTSLLPSWKRLD